MHGLSLHNYTVVRFPAAYSRSASANGIRRILRTP